MIIPWYKLDFRKQEDILEEMKTLSSEISSSFEKIEKSEESIKKMTYELQKVSILIEQIKPKAEGFEADDATKKRYAELNTQLSKFSGEVNSAAASSAKEMGSIIAKAKKMIFGGNALVFKEQKQIERYYKVVLTGGFEEKLHEQLMLKVNEANQDVKTAALKMYQAFSANDAVIEGEQPIDRIILSKSLEETEVRLSETVRALSALKISDIDEFMKDCILELELLKKAAMEARVMLARLKRHIAHLKEAIAELPEHESARKTIAGLEELDEKTRAEIAEQMSKLFKEIRIQS